MLRVAAQFLVQVDLAYCSNIQHRTQAAERSQSAATNRSETQRKGSVRPLHGGRSAVIATIEFNGNQHTLVCLVRHLPRPPYRETWHFLPMAQIHHPAAVATPNKCPDIASLRDSAELHSHSVPWNDEP